MTRRDMDRGTACCILSLDGKGYRIVMMKTAAPSLQLSSTVRRENLGPSVLGVAEIQLVSRLLIEL